MGRKGKWFDAVQRILSTSEPDPAETDAKAAKQRDKPSFKRVWQFGRSNSSGASTSAAPAPAPNPEAPHQPQPPPSARPDQHQAKEITAEAQREETRSADAASKAGADAAEAAAIARPTVTAPRAWIARSKEDIAATRIQAACRGYLASRSHQERGMARLMSLVEGFTIKRQTEEALYCMQTMTRIQTQIYSRRLKTEEDKKALKGQIKVEQSLDKTKIGEGWDHSLQSKEQMEDVVMMKQEAASRRQRAMAYAFSNQWRNRNPSSSRAVPAPIFMDPGNPNWGWSWTERWMAAARPWENQTAAPDNGRRAAAKSSGRMPRLAVSIQIPTTTTTTPKGRSFRPPSWPSLPSPSTPPPRSPSLSGRTVAVPAVSPRSGTLHASSGLHPDRRPRSSQELSAASSPRRAVPASPRGGGSGSGSPLHPSGGGLHPDRNRRPRSSQELSASSPRRAMPASPKGGGGGGSSLHASGGVQRAASMQQERRPLSSQERATSSPRHGAKDAPPPLRQTTSLRAELPRRLILGSAAAAAAAAVPAGDDEGAPVTPSYMQPTRSVKAKARCASPSASAAADTLVDAPESGLAPLRVPSPSSAKKRLSLTFADKPSASSPSKAAAERVMRRQSQPPSPRMSLA